MNKVIKNILRLMFLLIFLFSEILYTNKISFNLDKLKGIDILLKSEIKKGTIPGAVVLIGNKNRVVYLNAFGNRQTYNNKKKMTVDTVFDIASITKPIVTATSIWKLIEQGKICLRDKVSIYLPEFKKYKKSNLRIYHLLTHTGGFPASLNPKLFIEKYKNFKKQDLITEIVKTNSISLPGKSFKYSCLGYIILGCIVEKVSGKSLSQFANENIFSLLDMDSTTFNPKGKILQKISPTERINGKLLIGRVHDPLARKLGGISGNAGLFSSAEDLSNYAKMLVNDGVYKNKRFFSPLTVKAFISIYPKVKKFGRSPGWDVSSVYSYPKGDLLSQKSFGHTGFTGTSIWIDPKLKVYIIFLSNRVHPYKKKSIIRLYSIISNITAASIDSKENYEL